MIRMQGLPRIDPSEEKRITRENVKRSIYTFAAICFAIRLGKNSYSSCACAYINNLIYFQPRLR